MRLRVQISAVVEDPDSGSEVEHPIIASEHTNLDMRDTDVFDLNMALAVANEVIDQLNHRLSEADIEVGGNLNRELPNLAPCGHCQRVVDSGTAAEHSFLA